MKATPFQKVLLFRVAFQRFKKVQDRRCFRQTMVFRPPGTAENCPGLQPWVDWKRCGCKSRRDDRNFARRFYRPCGTWMVSGWQSTQGWKPWAIPCRPCGTEKRSPQWVERTRSHFPHRITADQEVFNVVFVEQPQELFEVVVQLHRHNSGSGVPPCAPSARPRCGSASRRRFPD